MFLVQDLLHLQVISGKNCIPICSRWEVLGLSQMDLFRPLSLVLEAADHKKIIQLCLPLTLHTEIAGINNSRIFFLGT
jgi:hypothetical protein